jgi:hypothetical protein
LKLPEFTDENLAALIRQMMPPRATDCIVQITDNHDWACALFSRNLLRVRRRWRTDVFDAGLHQMPCTIRSISLSGGWVPDIAWGSIAHRGRRVGGPLRQEPKGPLAGKHGSLALTLNGGTAAFGASAATAELGALREFSSAVIEKAEAVVHLIIDTYCTPTRVFRKFAN